MLGFIRKAVTVAGHKASSYLDKEYAKVRHEKNTNDIVTSKRMMEVLAHRFSEELDLDGLSAIGAAVPIVLVTTNKYGFGKKAAATIIEGDIEDLHKFAGVILADENLANASTLYINEVLGVDFVRDIATILDG